MAIRCLETTEEFFRPQFIQTNSQSNIDVLQDSNSEADENENENDSGNKVGKKSRIPIEKFSDDEDEIHRFRNMGFPNMKYLDQDVNGPSVAQNQQQTFYKEYQENKNNDIKN